MLQVHAKLDSNERKTGGDPPSVLPGYINTPGGGIMGGLFLGIGTLLYGPAPPNTFPEGCKWSEPKRIALIHIGKTAGGSVRSALDMTPLNWTHVHLFWHQYYFDPRQFDLFIVTVRDPVQRVISAFNWNHKIGGREPDAVYEDSMYDCYPELPGAVNHFAEDLDSPGPCGAKSRECVHSVPANCAHLSRDHSWYLETGIDRYSPGLTEELKQSPQKKAFVLSAENFSVGLDALSDWLCLPPDGRLEDHETHSDYPRHNDTYVSGEGKEKIAKHKSQEYFALEELATVADEWW